MYDVAELQGQCERVLSSCVTFDTYHLLANMALQLDCQQLKQVWLSADGFACACTVQAHKFGRDSLNVLHQLSRYLELQFCEFTEAPQHQLVQTVPCLNITMVGYLPLVLRADVPSRGRPCLAGTCTIELAYYLCPLANVAIAEPITSK